MLPSNGQRLASCFSAWERTPLLHGRVHVDVVSWDDECGGATMDARFTPQQVVDRSLPTPA